MTTQYTRRCALLVGCLLVAVTSCFGQKANAPVDNAVVGYYTFMHPSGPCLGLYGFHFCEQDAMWMIAKRKDGFSLVALFEPNPKVMCLEKKGSWLPWKREFDLRQGSCSSKGAKGWQVLDLPQVSHVSNQAMGYLTQHKHKYCLARGRKKYLHIPNMINCNRDPDSMAVLRFPNTLSFMFFTADNRCFDGQVFRNCNYNDSDVYFSVGVKFDWSGRPHRFFYKTREPSKCIVASRNQVKIGSCSESGALDWGWKEARLTYGAGKYCLARSSADESAAVLIRCYEGFEGITIVDRDTVLQDYLHPENQYQATQSMEQLMRSIEQQQREADRASSRRV